MAATPAPSWQGQKESQEHNEGGGQVDWQAPSAAPGHGGGRCRPVPLTALLKLLEGASSFLTLSQVRHFPKPSPQDTTAGKVRCW